MIARNSASRPSLLTLVLSLFISAMLLSGCGGGSASTNPNATPDTPGSGTGTPTTPTAIPLAMFGSTEGNVGKLLSYIVMGGTPPYIVISSAPGIAFVTPVIQLGQMYFFSATPLKDGKTTLILTDSKLAIASQMLTATIPPLKTTAGTAVTLAVDEEGKYDISGGQGNKYTATTSNASVASASIPVNAFGQPGSVLSIKGKLAGTATISVCDADCLNTTKIDITVVPVNSANLPFKTTAPIAITLGTGATKAQIYTNSGGTAPYTCTSNNVNIATASCDGSSMTITGVADGIAKVTVQDSATPTTNSSTIDVNVATGTGLTVIGQSDWSIPKAHCDASPYKPYDPPIFSIYFINGGTPPYTVSSSSPLIGTIIGTGTNSAPMTKPSGSVSWSATSWTVESGGYFAVAWPDGGSTSGANNHCAYGNAELKITDASGNRPSTVPTFKITVTE